MKNFNGQKVFSLEYDKETLKDMVLDKQEEIERQKEVINGFIDNEEKYNLEIIRLNNIINDVREYIGNNTYKIEWGDLEQDNEDININEDLTEKEFIEGLLEILEGGKNTKL